MLHAVSDRALALFLPAATAEACACDPAPYYQYRCNGSTAQRRRCSTNCKCTVFCGSWETVGVC
jgi:hypothetical protein